MADGPVDRRALFRPLPDGGFVGTYEDITEREQAHDELSEQYRRFDAALNNMSQGLCMLDASLHLSSATDAISRCMACRRDREAWHHDARDHGAQLLLGIHPSTTAARLYDEYGEKLKDNVQTLHRHLGDGRIVKFHRSRWAGGWVVTYEDVTERHAAGGTDVAHGAP